MTTPTPCPRCEGQGEIQHPRHGSPTCPDPRADCPLCKGLGTVTAGIARHYRNHHQTIAGRYWPIPEQEERQWPV